jgi:hypothetical protein
MADTLPKSLFVRAQGALEMTQTQMGALLSLSRSTIFRRTRGKAVELWPHEQPKLVQAVYRVDPALALEIVAALEETAERMGIAPLEPPQLAAPKPQPIAAHLVPHLVHAVVAAAADVAGQPPAALRQTVRAAFERAHAAGLTVEAVVAAMGDAPRGKTEPRPSSSKPQTSPRE